MGGRFSRQKGRRGEYAVRNLVRDEGYSSERVPLSGAWVGMKGDVTATKDGVTYVLEVKTRRADYTNIYNLFNKFSTEGVLRVSYPSQGGPQGVLVAVAKTLSQVLPMEGHYTSDSILEGKIGTGKGLRKLLSLRELKKTCDVIVIKDDRQPFLFIKYAV